MPNRVSLYIAQELTDEFREAPHCVVVDYLGLTAREAVDLRFELRAKEVRMRVIKNTLAARAFQGGALSVLGDVLGGSCAIVTGGEDMPSACKAVTEWMKKNKKMAVKGGFAEGRVMDADEVEKMAQIPPMPVLLAQFVGGVQGVAQQVAGAFQALAASIGRALEEIRRQKEAEEGGATAEPGA